MPHHSSARWLRKGDFLDLEDLAPDKRPAPEGQDQGPRFSFIRKQRITNLRPIKSGLFISAGGTGDFDQEGRTSKENRLKPDSKDLIMQVAVGLKNNFKLWIENPTDHSMRSLPNEVPNDNNQVGIVRPVDSPYFEPSLEATEFWIVKDIAADPTFHIIKETGGPIEPVISLRVNELVLEPVTDNETQQLLERRRLRSTPVDLKVEV